MRKYGLVNTPMSISIESTKESTLYNDMYELKNINNKAKHKANVKLAIATEALNQIKDILSDNLVNSSLKPTSFKAIQLCLESLNKHCNLDIDTSKFNISNYGGVYSKKQATQIALESIEGIELSSGTDEVTNSFSSQLKMFNSLVSVREQIKAKNNDLLVNVGNYFTDNTKNELIGLELPNSSTLQHIVNEKDVIDGKIQALSICNNIQSFKSILASKNFQSIVLEMKNRLNNLVNEFDIFQLDVVFIIDKLFIGEKYHRGSNTKSEYSKTDCIINNYIYKINKTNYNGDDYCYYSVDYDNKISPNAILVSLNRDDSNILLNTSNELLDNNIINDLKDIVELFNKVNSSIAEAKNRYKALKRECKVDLSKLEYQLEWFLDILIEIISFENMVLLTLSGYVGHSLKFIQDK